MPSSSYSASGTWDEWDAAFSSVTSTVSLSTVWSNWSAASSATLTVSPIAATGAWSSGVGAYSGTSAGAWPATYTGADASNVAMAGYVASIAVGILAVIL